MLKQDIRRFAPFGLYLAGLAVLASAILYVLDHTFSLPLQIALALIVVGLALFVILDPHRTRQLLSGRQARYGSNALVLTLAVVGILAVINYLGYTNTRRVDLTADKQNTLAPETIKSLESLKSAVKAEAFYSSQMPMGDAKTLLDNYKLNSKGKFDYEVIDPVQNPVRANQDKVTRDGTIVLKADNRMEQVSFASEQEMTGALVRLANPGERAVYFLTGHGENDINGTDAKAYSDVKSALTAKNYTVNPLDLLSKPEIPANALAIIIAGPNKPLSDGEITALKAYQEKGGALIYLARPRPVTQFAAAADPMAAYLKTAWGISLDEDMVIDLDNQQQPLIAIGTQFGSHAITDKMVNAAVALPIARSVSAAKTAPDGVGLTQLVMTTANAWGETDYQSIQNQQVTMDKTKDIVGPVSLAVAGTNSKTKARVVVIGNADFAAGQYYAAYGNSDLLLNSIDWAAAQDNLISLTPKAQTQRFLLIPQGYTMTLVLLGSVFLLPGLVLFTGILSWLQRRRRG